MWSGTNIPAGWALCDGTQGTPDLRDRFIVGAVGSYARGNTGGSSTHNHGGATASHVLTVAQMPSHNHLAPASDGRIPAESTLSTSQFSVPDNVKY